MSDESESSAHADLGAVLSAIRDLSAALRAQTQMTLDAAMYVENMVDGRSEQEGRASLARFVFTGSVSLGVIFAGAVYAAHNGIAVGLIIAKGLCLLGAVFSAMCVESATDRWKYEQIALSNAIEFEKRGLGKGMATSKRDAYEAPSLMPGRVNAASVVVSTVCLVAYAVLVHVKIG